MVFIPLCLQNMIEIRCNLFFWFVASLSAFCFYQLFFFSYNIKTFFSPFRLCDLITQFELCAVVSCVMFDAFLINFWARVALVHRSTQTHTNVHTELHTDKHILIGKINLLISLQLGVSIKYLVNKLPLPKFAIKYEPEGKWPICYGVCVCVCRYVMRESVSQCCVICCRVCVCM